MIPELKFGASGGGTGGALKCASPDFPRVEYPRVEVIPELKFGASDVVAGGTPIQRGMQRRADLSPHGGLASVSGSPVL